MGIMNFVKNPNKRMRLDLQNTFDNNINNEDIWGPEDITAEEFDMLEVQATQGASGLNSFCQPLPKTSLNNDVSLQIESTKQQQYELEGKVKILSDSLEMMKKELVEEKIKKEHFIAEKALEMKEKEKSFQKEFEKMKSSLQFKDQEMKAIYEKMKIQEAQLKEHKINEGASTSRSPNRFTEKFNFQSETSISNIHRQSKAEKSHRKYRLSVDVPEGKTPGHHIVSSLLCNRLFLPPPQNVLPFSPEEIAYSNQLSQLSAISITRLSLEHRSEEIFQYFYYVLKNFLLLLQSSLDQTSSSISFEKRELIYDKNTVISCLKDLSYIISCPQFSTVISNLTLEDLFDTEKKVLLPNKESSSTPSTSSVSNCDKKLKLPLKKTLPLLQLLFKLSNPDTYPNCYSKNEEIEWSLSTLVSWSAADSKRFIECFDDQVITSHICSCYDVTASCIVMKILINMCFVEEYLPKLIHSNESCHLCAIASLLLGKVLESPTQCVPLMSLIEDYLSTVFTLYSFNDIKLENAPCSIAILQAVLTSVQKYYEIRKDRCDMTLILKKGFTLLHFLSKFIPNFKNRRSDFESTYISLVSGMLLLSKEVPAFKEFYDIAHELWDFQEDMSEFDFEDSSDESMQPVNLIGQNDN